jgi:UDP-N-acetylmuramoyl-tripeptide--D-alanyl-D-alanine ligase
MSHVIDKIYQYFTDTCKGQICTDTRKINPGSLFLALKGENFDGNRFVADALQQGCLGAITSDSSFINNPNVFYVDDTLKTLQDLAHYHRKKFSFPVIGIGGSNGKTTHKELMHVVLSKKFKTAATKGNLNNHIGVPLTLLNVDIKNTEMLILEMGANHQGEYEELCRIAEPDFGLLTNIGRDHLEGFGGLEGVKKGNGELYDYIRKNKKKIFLNTSDAVLLEMAEGIEYIGYGEGNASLVSGDVVEEDPLIIRWKKRGGTDAFTIKTNFIGKHYLPNLLSAICAGVYWEVPNEDINEAISQYVPSMNRSQKVRTEKNELLLDAYNANPDSMEAAIRSFIGGKTKNKWMILGDMFELGTYSADEHQRICNILKENHFSNVILVGEEFYQTRSEFLKFKTTEECKMYLKHHPFENKYILLKGSRGMQLERLIEVL